VREVVALDVDLGVFGDSPAPAGVTRAVADVTDFAAVSSMIKPGDTVIHLAALKIRGCDRDPDQAVATNVTGTVNVARAAAAAGVRRVVFASAGAVYGEARYLPIDEDHPRTATNLYGATKISGEEVLNAFAETAPLNHVTLRLFNIYGSRSSTETEVLVLWSRAILRGEAPVIHGDGSQQLDFVHVDDVARAFVLACDLEVPPGTYNVGTGEGTTLKDAAVLLLASFGSAIEPVFTPAPRVGTATGNVPDISRAVERLGYSPAVNRRDGFLRLVDQVRQEHRS
jgi:UDP-glucose 4-epimerase